MNRMTQQSESHGLWLYKRNKIYLYFWYGIFIFRSDFFVFFSSQKLLVFCSFFSNDTRALTYISAANWEAGVWSDDSLLEDAQQWVMRFSLRPMEMLASLGQYSRETERENREQGRATEDQRPQVQKSHSSFSLSVLFTFLCFSDFHTVSFHSGPVSGDVTVTFLEHDMGNSDTCSLLRHQGLQ